jgi:hypothetical protein
MGKAKTTRPALTDAVYAELREDMKVLTIPHAMVIAGNAYRFGGERMATNAALLAMLIAEATGGDIRAAGETAWNAAQSIAESRGDD